MTLGGGEVLEFERDSARSHHVENSLWKRLQTCLKINFSVMNCPAVRTKMQITVMQVIRLFLILNEFQDVDSSLINFKILSLIKILSVPSLLLRAYRFCEANRQSFCLSVVNMPWAEFMIPDDKNSAYTYSTLFSFEEMTRRMKIYSLRITGSGN